MNLKIIAINGKESLEKEVVWSEAPEACRLQYYIILDTTYTSDGNISNELRHTFLVPHA